MAGQDVVVTYRADIDDLTQKLKIVIDRMDKLEAESKQAAKGLDTTTKSADKLGKELADVGKTTQKATNDVKGFAKSANTELSGLTSKVSSIGLGIAASLGAAFTVDAVIAFGKASVNAFLEAQENAEKLRFTITQVGGESEAAFQRLIDQSAKLQDITIFSDDSIQQAQNALATFGLTSDQISELLPKLADFASATKTDIVQAAQQVGAGLQGAGREFKKYGIEVSATASELDNLSAITDGFAKFQGAAAKETETLTGQLKQQENAADDLQEALGERLAPIFVRLKTVLFEAALGLLGFNKAANDLAQSNIDAVESNIVKSAEKIKAAGGDVVTEYSKRIDEIKAVNEKANADIETLSNALNDRLVQLSQSKLDVSPENDAIIKNLNAQVDAINKVVEANNVKVKSFQTVIDAEKKAAADAERALTAEQLRVKSLAELNDLLVTNGNLNDLLSKKNVSLINAELEARKKATDQAKKDADIRIAGTETEITRIQALGAEYAALFELLNDQDKAKLIELQVLATVDPEQFKAEVAKLAVESQAEVVVPLKLEVPEDRQPGEFKTGIPEAVESDLALWFERNEGILNSSMELMQSLQALSAQYTESRLAEINEIRDAQISAIEGEQESVDENLKKRRISEVDAQILTEQLAKKRADVEKKALADSNKLKKKQFNIDKAAALAEIAVDIAKGIAQAYSDYPYPASLAVSALIAGAGAVQIGLVASKPNPYKKGSKNTKEGLARVGEEGEEIVFMPGGSKVLPAGKTKTYGEVLDKMFDGTFDKHYMKREISPRLVAQRKVHEQGKEKSFAKNLSESIVLTSTGLTSYELEQIRRKGQNINNADEIGKSVARHIQQDIYRR